MDDTICLNYKQTVTFGEKCKCFSYGNNDQDYLLPRLDVSEQHNAQNFKAKDECLATTSNNYSTLCSEFQQIQIKDYENVKSQNNEYDEEVIFSSDLNRIRKFGFLTDETLSIENFQNQYGHSISPLNFMKKDVYSDDYSFNFSTNHFEADYNPEAHFSTNREEQISTSAFHQESNCETDPFNSIDKALSKEFEMMFRTNKCPSFSLEEKLQQNSYRTVPQETYFENNDFSTIEIFSENTNFLSVDWYEEVNEKSEVNQTECLNFPHITPQSNDESISLVDNVSELVESQQDANNILGPSGDQPNFIMSQNKNLQTCESERDKKSVLNQKSPPRIFKSQCAKNLGSCGISEKVFSSNNQLKRKRKTNTLEKSFVCNICKKGFTHKHHLIDHYRIHAEEKPFVCDVCKKGFTQKCNLNRHYRMHTNEKPFVCDTCGKEFTDQTSHVVHYGTHTGEMPYVCEICKKGFRQIFSLSRHKRIHDDDMPFGCDYCEKKFKHIGSLVAHHRTHTGEKPYECDKCQKRFNDQSNFIKHYRAHTIEKPEV